jgi:pseudouridine-5'-phosphate glycosidase
VSGHLAVQEEVRAALHEGRPVLALESTIIAHGLPRPRNVEVALRAEAEARARGVVPATVGIFDGRLCVGLEATQIEALGTAEGVLKVSRRDLAYALASRRLGATTVSGTMLAARQAGIRVFATGGIGGVHRGGEQSMDVSADLLELARSPVIVVSAGAKAILDLARTLEVLETQGVPVIGYRTAEFPAFYSRSSGLPLDLRAETPEEVIRLYRVQRELGLEQGILVANPIPAQSEIPRQTMEGYIEVALQEAVQQGVTGKRVTPFLLSRVLDLSGGRSLEANIALLLHNVHLGCAIARSL